MGKIRADILLYSIQQLDPLRALQPVRKLANITHIGGNRITGRLFYLTQVIFISAYYVQHETAYQFTLS